MTDFPFHYKGAVTLSDGTQYVDLHNVELWEERDVVEVAGEALEVGLRSWHGVAQAEGVTGRLLALMDTEADVRLADGRLGHAYVTGYREDDTWVVEISGIGPTPNLNTI